jgi:hypothetical protein
LFNYAPRNEDVWASDHIDPRIFNFVTRWRWVVSCTLRRLYSRTMNHRYPFDRRLDGRHGRSGRCGAVRSLLSLSAIELRFLGRPAHNIVVISTEIYRPTKGCVPTIHLYVGE